MNLIHLFDFYLAAMFLLGSYRRFEQYRIVAGIAMAAPGRWPKLFQLVRRHRTVFLTWNTLFPAAAALALLLANTAATRWVLPHARLTVSDLLDELPWLLALVPLGVAMLGVDGYFLVQIGVIDRTELEGCFNQAEHWLGSWQAPVVRALSFGWFDPRQMVGDKVREALQAASDLLNRSLWWTALQAALRVGFGLTLWSAWATLRPT